VTDRCDGNTARQRRRDVPSSKNSGERLTDRGPSLSGVAPLPLADLDFLLELLEPFVEAVGVGVWMPVGEGLGRLYCGLRRLEPFGRVVAAVVEVVPFGFQFRAACTQGVDAVADDPGGRKSSASSSTPPRPSQSASRTVRYRASAVSQASAAVSASAASSAS